MDNQPFTLKPSPFVMIALIAIILALVGVAAWHHAPGLTLGALAVSALALAVLAVALHRHASVRPARSETFANPARQPENDETRTPSKTP